MLGCLWLVCLFPSVCGWFSQVLVFMWVCLSVQYIVSFVGFVLGWRGFYCKGWGGFISCGWGCWVVC